jgi:hypothetical protein
MNAELQISQKYTAHSAVTLYYGDRLDLLRQIQGAFLQFTQHEPGRPRDILVAKHS